MDDILENLKIRKLNLSEVRRLVYWAELEGWNPSDEDAEAFYETDPEGFVGYFFDNEMIAGGSIVSYNDDFGFMGFFIVKPEYRSKGIGRKLWYERRNMLISRLKPGATIGMDGVVAMQPFYAKGGFELAFRDERFERIGGGYNYDNRIIEFSADDLEIILEYDKKCFGYERRKFMNRWINLNESKRFMFIDDGQLRGFAITRRVKKGFKICPLFADDSFIADELYKACLNSAPNLPVYLDIPVINPAAVELVKKYNATYVFECARMYYGSKPEIDINSIYGITTYELG
ncbi:MAG: GNAT family N-acetyltransferase [Candidatus Kapabacteria bacterium]|nr:GNAT family N-acetyltransferase [Ignavibacteriota bacterium]MCW5886070.1 GNAT family N-acetyltransferase [Candidatus Kapabacteria bacterium]